MTRAKQLASVRNRRNGHKFEILVWNRVNHGKCRARVISSGSKGLFDVWAITKTNVRLIICRTNGYLTPKEKEQYARFLEYRNSWERVDLFYYKSPKIVTFKMLRTPADVLNWKGPKR